MGERCICRKRENCPCLSTLWVSSELLGVTRFAAGHLPGPAETGFTFKSFPSHPRRVSLFSFSPTLACGWGFPNEGERALPRAPCSGLSLPVAGLAGEPGGGHGTRPCDCVLGRVCTMARGRDPRLASPDAWGKEALPAPAPLTAASRLVMQATGRVSFVPAASR